jgi:hypothetical protein
VYNIFCCPIFRQHKQTRWLESTSRIIVRVKNIICSNLSHRHRLALRLIDSHCKYQSNWKLTRLNCIGTSVGIIVIRGNNIFSPQSFPFKMMASIIFFINFLMTNRVLLHNCSGFKLRSKITGNPTFSCKLCGVLPGKSNEFKSCWIIYSFSSIVNCINRFV